MHLFAQVENTGREVLRLVRALQPQVLSFQQLQSFQGIVPWQQRYLRPWCMLHRKLFDADDRCSICKQRILRLEDAEVDHIVPFAEGGRTEASNAQLLHTYCNRQKGKKAQDLTSTKARLEAACFQENDGNG